MVLGPCLKWIPHGTGLDGQRAVPRQLHKKLGKKTWQFQAGDTSSETRRNVQYFPTKTDAEIADATGVIEAQCHS